VLLDVIIVAFQRGATPEDIAQQFPSVALPDVYLIIAHYLTHDLRVFKTIYGLSLLQRRWATYSIPDVRVYVDVPSR